MERPNSLPTQRRWTDNGAASNGANVGLNRQTSLSVLSPFDEQEEWLKILEILDNCNSRLGTDDLENGDDSHLLGDVKRELQIRFDAMTEASVQLRSDDVIDVPLCAKDSVADWLLSLGLQQYLGMFLANGFDDVDFLGDGIVDDASLIELGVLDPAHRHRLVSEAATLKTPLRKLASTGLPDTVDDWLHFIKLDHYAEHFRKNRFDDMERVGRIWEVELTTVVEIRLVGHLRRILVSLQQRPEHAAACRPVPKPCHQYVKSAEDLTSLTSDLQKISTNIAKLEDELSSKIIDSSNTISRQKSAKNQGPTDASLSTNRMKPSHQTLERALDELAIRDPSELVIGIAKTVATQWRHKPQELLRPGVRYQAKYLGSTLVRHVRGTESTKRSIQKLKKKYASDQSKAANITVAISLGGVQFLDPQTQVAICKHDIRNINWACQDADDLTHFAYITKDQQRDESSSSSSTQLDHFCHVFQVPTMDLATEIILTLGQAFEVAYQLVLREDLSSPPASQPDAVSTPTVAAPKSVVKPALAPKPAILPKPKLGTAILGHQKTAKGGLQHSRSQSSVDRVFRNSAMVDTRLQSESNLASLQATVSVNSVVSSASVSSFEASSVRRAPLAAKDEL